MIALKRLSDAERDGDPVLALIRGSAVGHDGPSAGLTVPSGTAQASVLTEALRRANIDPNDVNYIEAHGTGTKLGDPIEVHAIEQVYARDRGQGNPLHIGAVKSNIGHLEVAAGAASVIKVALALGQRTIPPHLHFSTPNPDLDLSAHEIVVDTAPTPWESPRGPRRAGVSSFGLAGTNVHIVMEEAPARLPPREPASPDLPERPLHLLLLSARSPEALTDLAQRYSEVLSGGASLPDIAYSAATTRIPYEHRLAVTAATAPEASLALRHLRTGPPPESVRVGETGGRVPRVAFLFSGQGSQYPAMARDLYGTEPVFREIIDRCVAKVGPELREILLGDDLRVHDTTYTQPALFAVEVALAALWRSYGIVPSLLLGHSIGQIAAATVAGVLTVEDGAALVAERGRLMGALPEGGAMMAVMADEATTAEIVGTIGEELGPIAIAAVNSPSETTVSGTRAAIDALSSVIAARGIEGRALTVSHAFHSPLMEPMLDAFEAFARTIRYGKPEIPVVCNLTGEIASEASLGDPAYWRSLVARPVRFAGGLAALEREGVRVMLEVGPHTALLGMARRTLTSRDLSLLPSMQRGKPAHERLVPTLGALFTLGLPVDWLAFEGGRRRQRVQLPTYPWQRRRIWPELEEFPGRKVASDPSRWLVERRWEASMPSPVDPVGDWAVIGSDPSVRALEVALVKLGARTVDSARAASAGIVVIPGIPSGIGADPTGPARELLAVVQSLDEAWDVPLTVVIRGDEPLAGTLLGLARAVRAERPLLRVVTLEIPGDEPVDSWMSALLARDREPEARVTAGLREVARLHRASLPGSLEIARLTGGAVLVTGGLGGVGLETARWLATHGATELVLVGRSEPSDASAQIIEEIRAGGAVVHIERGDVGEAADVERIVGSIARRGSVLVGVVHAAGVLADASLGKLDEASFRKVFAPKVLGSFYLHQATADLQLRFFVMFAAGAGLMGSPGQGNYAAANAFQDAFARWLRARGVPALAIDWGSIGSVGMAARAGDTLRERQAAEGIHPVPLQQGLDLFGLLLSSDLPQIGVLNVDWARFVSAVHRGIAPPLLLPLLPVQRSESASPRARQEHDASEGPSLLASLAAAPRAQWGTIAEQHVQDAARRILRLPRERAIDPQTPLLDLGLDSLLAVELKNAILDGGVDIPVARVMTGPPVRQIGQMVITAVEERGLASSGAVERHEGPAKVTSVAGEGPPINIFASHLGAFLFGVLFVVVSYVGTAYWSSLRASEEASEFDPVEATTPSRGKRR